MRCIFSELLSTFLRPIHLWSHFFYHWQVHISRPCSICFAAWWGLLREIPRPVPVVVAPVAVIASRRNQSPRHLGP
jgi:hypothetical protein